MRSATIRPFLLALALPASLAAPVWAGGPSINNDVKIKVPGKVLSWKLTFVSGQGTAADAITISPAEGKAKLQAKGDSAILKAGKTYTVTFSPNYGTDGSKYGVTLTDSYSNCKECTVPPKRDQYVTFKAEKPADSMLTQKAKRKLVLTPDFKGDYFLIFSGAGQGEELEKETEIASWFKDGTWTLGGSTGRSFF